MSPTARRHLLLSVAAFFVGLIATLLWLRQPMEPLTAERLRAARAQWDAAGLSNYDLSYKLNHNLYEVRVRDRLVVEARVDGQAPHGANLGAYSMRGLFETLEMELENMSQAGGAFSASSANVLARVRFHRRYGSVERYLRTGGGFGRSAVIDVLELRPINP